MSEILGLNNPRNFNPKLAKYFVPSISFALKMTLSLEGL